MIAAMVVGLMVIAGITVVNAYSTNDVIEEEQPDTATCGETCGNSCSAQSNCGLATCGATKGGSCGCGK